MTDKKHDPRRNWLALSTLLLAISIVGPTDSAAFVTEPTRPSLPGYSTLTPETTAGHGPPQLQQIKRQPHLPGRLILKFKDASIVGAVADDLVRGKGRFRDITGNPSLDTLNQRFKVTTMENLFAPQVGTSIASPRHLDRQAAMARHQQQHDRFKARVAAVQAKRQQRRGVADKAPIANEPPPFLDFTYLVTVDPQTDLDQACREYALDPDIAYCQPDFRIEAQWTPNDPYLASFGSWQQGYDDLWGLKKLEATTAWDISKGANVVVAVVDTGVDYNHVDLAANIWTNAGEIPGNGIDDDANGFIDDVRGWDFTTGNNDPMDAQGHGTHVAGTIAAIADNGIGIAGVAPAARIMPAQGLDSSGSGSASNLAAAIRYAVDNGADVINNSWGCGSPCSLPVAEDAVKYAHDLGAVVVFAAGNKQSDVMSFSPTNQANNVITVAASSELDKRSYFSNLGSVIDVAAPGGGDDGTSSNRAGRNILSLRAGTTDMYGDGLCIVGTSYYRSRGTSMAAPHVAGVAALVLAKNPQFTPDDVSQALRVSADDIESPGEDLLSGAGRVNALKALNVNTVPRVRITGPLAPVNIRTASALTINGDAHGPDFANYRLYYATLDKTVTNGQYTPTAGPWQPLGNNVFQSVTNGVLGTFDLNQFQSGKTYLLKLEVTTGNNLRFSDVKEVLFYEEDPRFYKIGTVNSYVQFPISAGDRFAWIDREPTPGETATFRYLGKVYDGATNKLATINVENGDVTNIGLTTDRIIWSEGNTPQGGRAMIGTMTAAGEILTEWTSGFGSGQYFSSADQDTILMCQEGFNPSTFARQTTGFLMDARTRATSAGIPLPEGDNINKPSLVGNSILTGIYYPNQGLPDEVYVTNTDTRERQLLKTVTLPAAINRATQGSKAVVWVESNWGSNSFPLMFFNKATQQIQMASNYSHGSSFASAGDRIIYSAWGNESGYTINNLYNYDIPSATTTLYATNYAQKDEMNPTIGTKHVQWVRGSDIMVFNELPVLTGGSSRLVAANLSLTVMVTATDAEGDKLDVSIVGGTWPGAPAALPAGASFTDNGDGTGQLTWTPSVTGSFPLTFLARDFSGRKDDTWTAVQTGTIQVVDSPTLPMLGVGISGSGTVHSSPAPDINCTANFCSQSHAAGTLVTLTAAPQAGFTFSGWSGDCTGTGNCSVTVDRLRNVAATFTKLAIPTYNLAVTILTGSGTVRSTPAPDLNCSSGTCNKTYPQDTLVTLTAHPAFGFSFSSWSGSCTGTAPCAINMTQNRGVNALFSGCGSMVSSNCYSYILEALLSAPDGSVIKTAKGSIYQSLETTRPVSLTLEGGYDSGFATRSGQTTVPKLTITGGSLTISDLIIQ